MDSAPKYRHIAIEATFSAIAACRDGVSGWLAEVDAGQFPLGRGQPHSTTSTMPRESGRLSAALNSAVASHDGSTMLTLMLTVGLVASVTIDLLTSGVSVTVASPPE